MTLVVAGVMFSIALSRSVMIDSLGEIFGEEIPVFFELVFSLLSCFVD
jgi:hypothetical protein